MGCRASNFLNAAFENIYGNYDVAKLELDEKQNPYIRAERNTENPIFHLFKITINETDVTLTDEAMGISYTSAFDKIKIE